MITLLQVILNVLIPEITNLVVRNPLIIINIAKILQFAENQFKKVFIEPIDFTDCKNRKFSLKFRSSLSSFFSRIQVHYICKSQTTIYLVSTYVIATFLSL